MEIKKAIILMAGVGTRFLPLSKVLPKELWPIVDLPVVQRIINEAREAKIEQIIFVLSPDNKRILEYLNPSPKIEKMLMERKKEKLLAEYREFEKKLADISFSVVYQKEPMGDGHAILQTAKIVGDEPVANFFADDIVESEVPCLTQLMNTFKACQRPVLALARLPKGKINAYGVVGVEKIANRLFKAKEIIEKPAPGTEPSDLAIVGKHILTPEVFGYLKKAKPSEKKEIILAEVLSAMLADGKVIYGYEFEGKWLECGTKLEWMKSNIYLTIKDPVYGPEIKKFIKENRLI